MKGIIRIVSILFFIIVADQFSKIIIKDNFYVGESIPVLKDFFSITYVRNPGAAFGFLAAAHEMIRKIFLIVAPLLFGIWLGRMIWTTRANNILLNVGYTMILAGGVGNLIDRLLYGYVVDYLDFFYGTYHWPAFNVADSSITIGAIFLVLELLISFKKTSSNNIKQSE